MSAELFSAQEVAAPAFQPGNLATKFLEPPFTVLDSRGGRWQERRRAWLSLGIQSELGRDGALLSHATQREGFGMDYDTTKGENAWGGSGTSIFDPVLCELAYRWWAPEGGQVLDPFAGGSVRGIVAAKLGHPYTGIDLSAAQVEANRAQAAAILGPEEPQPTWLHGDSTLLEDLLPPGQMYDMIWSCPPYFDLEVYSDDPADLSAMDWPGFMLAYDKIIEAAVHRLLPERFAAFVVSEIRDGEGAYRGLVPYTIHAFQRAGMRYYNEAVLLNSAGSLPLRVTRYMEASRKLGRSHQNILCFVKGGAPRGWSLERAAPPSPQLDLHLVAEADVLAAAQQAPAAPAVVPPEPVRGGAEAPDAAPGPSEPSGAPGSELLAAYGPEAGLISQQEADELMAGKPEAPCSRPYCTLPAGHAMGHRLEAPPEEPEEEPPALLELEDGRLADVATGEVLTAEGETYDPAELETPAEELEPLSLGWTAGVEVEAVSWQRMPAPDAAPRKLSEPPMPLEQWLEARERLYDPNDPKRPCWGCGRPPVAVAPDGGPQYERHSHLEGLQ